LCQGLASFKDDGTSGWLARGSGTELRACTGFARLRLP